MLPKNYDFHNNSYIGVPGLQTRGKTNEHHCHPDQRDCPNRQHWSTPGCHKFSYCSSTAMWTKRSSRPASVCPKSSWCKDKHSHVVFMSQRGIGWYLLQILVGWYFLHTCSISKFLETSTANSLSTEMASTRPNLCSRPKLGWKILHKLQAAYLGWSSNAYRPLVMS